MKIHTLRLHNFRKFEDYVFRFHPRFTVLIGDNASGKTTILDAIAIMLGTWLMKSEIAIGKKLISSDEIRLKTFEKDEIVNTEPQKPCFLEAKGELEGQFLTWKRKHGDRGKDASQIIQIGEQKLNALRDGKDVDMPVLLYYGAGRFQGKHRRIPPDKPDSRAAGYKNCLEPRSDHHLFEKWFKQLELSAIQKQKQIPVLESVREAVKQCIPGSSRFYYDVTHDAIMIEIKSEGCCLFNNLSDGYRNMLAMAADIAHRAARLNPHMGKTAARETSGVVLIDEINLHLHPKWQRRVVGDLKNAFPKIQFIATTHSPFIIQSLAPGEVIDLNEVSSQPVSMELADSETGIPGPAKEYAGKSIEDITEDIMGVDMPQRSRRHQEMYDAAKEYYTILQETPKADPQKKEELKKKLDELSAPFSDNVAYHAFLEMERMATGLGKSEQEKK